MSLPKRPNKKKLIKYIENQIDIRINELNFNVSSINSNGIYSVEPKLKCIEEDWFLTLLNTKSKKIYLFVIPKNNSIYNDLYVRDAKGTFRLIFSITDNSFREESSYKRFDVYLKNVIDYHKDIDIFNS